MEALPDDVLWYIYKKYWSLHVLDELSTRQEFLWRNPSKQLQDLCTHDKGSIQFGANDLWEMIEDHNLILLDGCLRGECLNCKAYKWPCDNMAVYGFKKPSLTGIWGDI
jgi:hypothetical protein